MAADQFLRSQHTPSDGGRDPAFMKPSPKTWGLNQCRRFQHLTVIGRQVNCLPISALRSVHLHLANTSRPETHRIGPEVSTYSEMHGQACVSGIAPGHNVGDSQRRLRANVDTTSSRGCPNIRRKYKWGLETFPQGMIEQTTRRTSAWVSASGFHACQLLLFQSSYERTCRWQGCRLKRVAPKKYAWRF